jgi:acryloyl-coenzyme A reductase
MRAVILEHTGPPESFKLRNDVDVPVPGHGDVLVQVKACGVDSHDRAVRAGLMRHEFRPGMILGHEIAGDVVEVGAAVRSVHIGDRVCCKQTSSCGLCRLCRTGEEQICPEVRFNEGGLAEYVALPEDAWVQIPDAVDYPSAAVSACAIGTVLHAIREIAQVKVGEQVLVTGAGGGLGLHAIQLAKLFGADVVAVTRSGAKHDAIVKSGADHILIDSEADDPLYERILEATNGDGVDVVIDTVGHPVFEKVLRALALFGRYVLVGQVLPEKVSFHPAFLFGKQQRLLSTDGTRRHELQDVLSLVRDNKVVPVVSRVVGLEGVVGVHHALDAGEIVGRAVIDPMSSVSTSSINRG